LHENFKQMQKNIHSVSSLFVHNSAAQRYASARPYFHPLVMQKIIANIGISRFSTALDVTCETGQSSQALADIVDQVNAIDVSPVMIAEAKPHERIRDHVASVEVIPFSDSSFELITVGLAFHWFDQAQFLCETHRVLKAEAWLVIYTSGFLGEMVEDQTFDEWAHKTYPEKFPTPPRHNPGVAVDSVKPFGFILLSKEKLVHHETMTSEQLTSYLLTQTNIIAAVENGTVPLEAAASWILNSVKPFFSGKHLRPVNSSRSHVIIPL